MPTKVIQDENKENENPQIGTSYRKDNVLISGAQLSHSAPRQRQPLRTIDQNSLLRNTNDSSQIKSTTPLLEVAAPQRMCKTEPAKGEAKRIVSPMLNDEASTKKKRTKPVWTYDGTEEACKKISNILDMDCPDDVNCPKKLFEHYEKEGQLTAAVLKLFSRCPDILTISMTSSYASKVNMLNLLEPAKNEAKGCTIPLYSGYKQLVALDLTNVEIGDDELRYLIKFGSLKALGLSGTKITAKGLKFLKTHAAFIQSMLCLKVCYNENITDEALPHLRGFNQLQELDLLGTSITHEGVLGHLFNDDGKLCFTAMQSIRLPSMTTERLDDLHEFYWGRTAEFENCETQVDKMTIAAVKTQLTRHKRNYANIYIGGDSAELRRALKKIIMQRQQEELLWSLGRNFRTPQ